MIYFDGQFDDARLLINLVTTAAEQGAALLNYARVKGVNEGWAEGFPPPVAQDAEPGEEFQLRAEGGHQCNGPSCDELRRLADPSADRMIAPSEAIHLVFDGSFIAGDSANDGSHTSDGR